MSSDEVPKAKLWFTISGREAAGVEAARDRLARDFSHVEVASEVVDEPKPKSADDDAIVSPGPKEMNHRLWFSTYLPAFIPELVEIKRFCLKVEAAMRADSNAIAITPGYATSDKAIAAYLEDAPHRLLIARGVFGEAVLRLTEAETEPWPWTSQEFRTPTALQFFRNLRSVYLDNVTRD